MKVNCALVLPNPILDRAIETSRYLSTKYETYFILGRNGNYPHITVWSGEVDQAYGVKRILDFIEPFITSFQSLACMVAEVEAHQGYLGVTIAISDEILCFHDKMVAALMSFRKRSGHGADNYQMGLTQAQMENVRHYGYPDALDLYRPHFTLTRLRNEREENQALQEEPVQELLGLCPSFTSPACALYTMGDHGTCDVLLERYNFGA